MEDKAVKTGLVAVASEAWKNERTSDRRFVGYALVVEVQDTIKIVRLSPAQREAAITLGAVVMSIPPELDRTRKAKFDLSIEYRTGQSIDWVPDQARIHQG